MVNRKKSKVIDNNDIRKSVRENNGRSPKRIDKRGFLYLFFIIILVCAFVFIINKINNSYKVVQEVVSEYNYFILEKDGKFGIIDKNGNEIINPEYEYIQIPNPSKDVFICMYDYNESSATYNSKVLDKNGKEIYTNYKNIQAISENNTSNELSYQTSILMYKENDKYGIIAINGKKITKPIYDSIETLEYKDGVLKIKQDEKYGLIDINGNQIIEAKYNMIMSDGYYSENTKYENAGYIVNVRTDTGYKYGYINSKGKSVIDTIYNNITRITDIKEDGIVYLITYKNGLAGLMKNGQTVIENEYEKIEYDKTNNCLAVQKSAKVGVHDLSNDEILPIQYDEITFLGNRINAKKDGELLIFDSTGTKKTDGYKSVSKVENSDYYITINANDEYGVINKENVSIIANNYSYIEYAFDKYFIASKNNKIGVVDEFGNIIIDINNDVVQNIKGTKIIQTINSETKESKFFDKDMKNIFTIEGARIYLENNYIKVVANNSIKYFDYGGLEKQAKDIFIENDIYAQEKDGKWGYVDKNSNTIVDYKYEMATNINKYGYGAIKQNGKWGVVDSKGNIIVEPKYELTDLEPSFIGEYYKINSNYQIEYYTNK